ncbi:MAG: PD-(D/E)XK nuclease family protein [Bacteroidota bacterium]
MIQELYKLYHRHDKSTRIPLEDFNTEVFAGILRLYPDILNAFTIFLNLPEDNYLVLTQTHYRIEADPNCRIDLELRGSQNVCFIENKVHSAEGHIQLDRYCRAMDKHYNNKSTYLRYCTKYSDPKLEKRHNFQQIRWYQVAKLLENYDPNPQINDYLKFLKLHQMSVNFTLSAADISAIANTRDTSNKLALFIQDSRDSFKAFFKPRKYSHQNSIGTNQHHTRIANYTLDILKNREGYTELLYCMDLERVKLQTQIYIQKSHPQKVDLLDVARKFGKFKIDEVEPGFIIYRDYKIYHLIDNSAIDKEVKEWFYESFEIFAAFIFSTPELNWDIIVDSPQIPNKL